MIMLLSQIHMNKINFFFIWNKMIFKCSLTIYPIHLNKSCFNLFTRFKESVYRIWWHTSKTRKRINGIIVESLSQIINFNCRVNFPGWSFKCECFCRIITYNMIFFPLNCKFIFFNSVRKIFIFFKCMRSNNNFFVCYNMIVSLLNIIILKSGK